MRVRTVSAAVALAAAVCVYALVREDRRRMRRRAAAERLMAGCAERDNTVLRAQVAAFRCRLEEAVARDAVAAAARAVLDDALATHSRIDPYPEGGPR